MGKDGQGESCIWPVGSIEPENGNNKTGKKNYKTHACY